MTLKSAFACANCWQIWLRIESSLWQRTVVSDVETVATKVILLRAGKIVDAAPVPELD